MEPIFAGRSFKMLVLVTRRASYHTSLTGIKPVVSSLQWQMPLLFLPLGLSVKFWPSFRCGLWGLSFPPRATQTDGHKRPSQKKPNTKIRVQRKWQAPLLEIAAFLSSAQQLYQSVDEMRYLSWGNPILNISTFSMGVGFFSNRRPAGPDT